EVRSYFLNNKFYSMAIFSQLDSLSELDFKRFSDFNPPRTVPYKLPFYVEEKLNLLMNFLQLDNGSIDLIMSSKGDFVFLEINPLGQFGMVSVPCNYNIEHDLAKYLIELDEDKN